MESIRSLMINLDLIISSLKTEQVFPSIQKIPGLIDLKISNNFSSS